MTLSELEASLQKSAPPAGSSPALAALWWARKDNWDKAHRIVMDEGGKDCAWVHAYLHRVEGDLDNARYWYRRAERSLPVSTLSEEWTDIARSLLVSLWFRRLYESVLQSDTNVGTGTLAAR